MNTYLFSYMYSSGFGNTYVTTEAPLSRSLIEHVERTMREKIGQPDVCVMNVVELAE
jgi:hypothetical protein